MKYLFIGAHADDVELCCGGTISKLNQAGNEVHTMAFSNCKSDQIDEEWALSTSIMNLKIAKLAEFENRVFDKCRQQILDKMIDLQRQFSYDYVFTHSIFDGHQDHKVVAQESIRAFKSTNLISYIAPWNQIGHNPADNYFVELKSHHIEKKIEACMCYKSQRHRPYMNDDFLWAQARIAGIKCQSEFAEAFQVLKLKS